MNIQEDIQDLVLGFFDTINAGITSTDDGIYIIRVPELYQQVFESQELRIVFDNYASPKHDYELVVPGNKILSQVIEICTNKGPVKVKQPYNNVNNTTLRYHFFIHFSGRSDMLVMDHVDVELAPRSDTDSSRRSGNGHTVNWMDSDEVTRTYMTSLKELQKRYDDTSVAFLHDANQRLVDDVRLFAEKYNLRVRELDNSIKYKDRVSDDSDRTREFRFQVADKIDALEKERKNMIDVIQKKHRVVLSYELVACEVILR